MVTRKPVAPPVETTGIANNTTANNAAPPYPETPTAASIKTSSSVYSQDLKNSPAFDLIDMGDVQKRPRRDSDVSSHGTWDSDGTERDEDLPEDYVEVPSPLKVKNGSNVEASKESELPAALKPGPPNGAIVGTRANGSTQYEEEAQSNPWQLESNNPYLQRSKPQNSYIENSSKVWEQPLQQAHRPPPSPSHAPPPPPAAAPPAPPVESSTLKSPSQELANLSLGGNRKSTETPPSYQTAEVLPVPPQGRAPLPYPTSPAVPTAPALPSTNPWADNAVEPSPPVAPPKEALSPVLPEPLPAYEPPPGPPPSQQQSRTPSGAGPLIDHAEPSQPPRLSTRVSPSRSPEIPETPRTRDRRQRSEHYQIKHVNWYDSSSGSGSLRRSPILTQNANGPCPLLALVNALVLSTPKEMDTALVETLRSREQVSLGLLLDAVFDELMSGRRGQTANELPDVGDLYAFLLALHTGMNVNPRFITPAATPRGSLDGHPPELHNLHPSERSQSKPGCFEETREMRLYSTFNVPLIHGWTAPKDTPVYQAFQRSAPSFEDAQNIQFAEAELEDKSRTEGLSFQEQQALEDIQTIKGFLQNWPTQLTDYGLDTISRSLHPGQIAILFRNDHFSTLYKEPDHGALMTLVTDAGYSSHDEIVWESLVDVNGAASELFSGDFRTVSHSSEAQYDQGHGANYQQPSQNGSSENATPPLPGPRPLTIPQSSPGGGHDGPLSPAEQEDHDLALALQLQEEEEDQQRQAQERRRREQELSEQFLENEERPALPPRRAQRTSSRTNIPIIGGRNRQSSAPQARPAVSRPAEADDPDAPPSYEQSASDRPYRPAGATAPTSQGNPLNTLDALRRQQSGYTQQSSTSVNSIPGSPGPPGHARRPSGNRLQRRSTSQMSPDVGNPSGPAPAYPGAYPGRTNQAATIRDAEGDRCVMM